MLKVIGLTPCGDLRVKGGGNYNYSRLVMEEMTHEKANT